MIAHKNRVAVETRDESAQIVVADDVVKCPSCLAKHIVNDEENKDLDEGHSLNRFCLRCGARFWIAKGTYVCATQWRYDAAPGVQWKSALSDIDRKAMKTMLPKFYLSYPFIKLIVEYDARGYPVERIAKELGIMRSLVRDIIEEKRYVELAKKAKELRGTGTSGDEIPRY